MASSCLSLKGPDEKLLNKHKNHPDFTSKLSNAIKQARDYGEFLSHPDNERKLLQQLGYIPTQLKLAVLIGRDVDRDDHRETMARRLRYVPDVQVITYDKILETQAAQMSRIVIRDFNTSILR